MNNLIRNAIELKSARSAWSKGVKALALELIDSATENGIENPTKEQLLNGAANWYEWSYGGCGHVYDADIAEAFCSPSELKRCKGGDRQPNRNETWLDMQARAASQAAHMIQRAIKSAAV
jgi:hypothetical protein